MVDLMTKKYNVEKLNYLSYKKYFYYFDITLSYFPLKAFSKQMGSFIIL